MKKLKLPLAIMAILFAAAGMFAFTVKGHDAKKAQKHDTVIYHYIGTTNTLPDMKDINNWEVVETATGCGDAGNFPCSQVYSDDPLDFQAFLSGFTNAGTLISTVDTRRSN